MNSRKPKSMSSQYFIVLVNWIFCDHILTRVGECCFPYMVKERGRLSTFFIGLTKSASYSAKQKWFSYSIHFYYVENELSRNSRCMPFQKKMYWRLPCRNNVGLCTIEPHNALPEVDIDGLIF